MDEHSVFFFEKYLSDLCNSQDITFSNTNLLVTLETLFKMMENGQYSINKLKLIFLHLIKIKVREQPKVYKDLEDGEMTNEEDQTESYGNDELILDMINKFWSKALGQWLPIVHYEKVCKYIADLLL